MYNGNLKLNFNELLTYAFLLFMYLCINYFEYYSIRLVNEVSELNLLKNR